MNLLKGSQVLRESCPRAAECQKAARGTSPVTDRLVDKGHCTCTDTGVLSTGDSDLAMFDHYLRAADKHAVPH